MTQPLVSPNDAALALFQALQDGQDKLFDKVDAVRDKVETVRGEVAELRTLVSRMDKADARQDRFETRLDDLGARLRVIEEGQSRARERLKPLANIMDRALTAGVGAIIAGAVGLLFGMAHQSPPLPVPPVSIRQIINKPGP